MLNELERRILEKTEGYLMLMEAVRQTGSNMPPEYFGYNCFVRNAGAGIPVGVTRSATITIQADAWFVAQEVSCGVILPNGSTTGDLSQYTDGGNVLLQISPTGAGDPLFSQPAGFAGFPAINVSGSPLAAAAGIPYVFPAPILFPPFTNVRVDFTPYGFTAVTNPLPIRIDCMLNGARVPLGALPPS